MPETKLKLCKCGGHGVTTDGEPTAHALTMLKEYGLTPMRRFKVICSKCGKETRSYTCKEDAWEAWNRRTDNE